MCWNLATQSSATGWTELCYKKKNGVASKKKKKNQNGDSARSNCLSSPEIPYLLVKIYFSLTSKLEQIKYSMCKVLKSTCPKLHIFYVELTLNTQVKNLTTIS